jgi:hypothetical protein
MKVVGNQKNCLSLMWESYVKKFNQFHFSKVWGLTCHYGGLTLIFGAKTSFDGH